MDRPWTGLAEAIAAVRAELVRAKELGAGSAMPFEVGPVEIQFTVALINEGKASAGIKVWVLGANASSAATDQQTHQLKVTLQPRGEDGLPEHVGADDFNP
ncbi:trypco2 family protein [Actinomadura montaniterrae]|uniref:Trypsin-co-occurring domain-containing protein n=1 Tax=Actinomadura montaniterrae TaxID=1803903 RepID=A0A6L3VRC4_9ACTN|nr:trypco2 family protein [Actinomadura montaniterrae]KAB2379305.1 hypothetical protein F9B16_21075 [Actinomadura montaniterrae]